MEKHKLIMLMGWSGLTLTVIFAVKYQDFAMTNAGTIFGISLLTFFGYITLTGSLMGAVKNA